MTDVNNIRDAVFEKGYSISEAAREFQRDRKTVRKYIYKDDFNQDAQGYAAGPEKPIKLSPYMPIIDSWLEIDKRMPANSGTPPGASTTGFARKLRASAPATGA